MNTCFILTHVPDPKTNKRIAVLKTKSDVTVICTRRKSQDIWEPAFPDVKYEIFDIDLPPSNKIIKRAIVSREYQKKAYSILAKLKPELIYADGLDSLIIIEKYRKRFPAKVVYDVADLREAYIEKSKNIVKSIINELVKGREKRGFNYVDYLVITSPKFYELYYHKLISKKRTIYIPNAPDKEVFSNYKKKTDGLFTVGFIGGIRYINQMKMLVDAAEKVGCRVLFAGAGGTASDYESITEYCKNKPWVSITGKYDYNKEIALLYGKTDCIYAVYNADNPNVRIALPNKLYESVNCGLPIIVAKGTYLSEIVDTWGVGISVSHKNVDELTEGLIKLRDDKAFYDQIVRNCKAHNVKDESEKLLKIIVG